jgi:hypothetical protein
MRWLRWLNPLAGLIAYLDARRIATERRLEWERLERAEQAELFRQTITSMTGMVEKAFEANRAQNAAFEAFLAGFKTPERPKIREYDEAEQVKRFVERRGGGTPPALAGLSQLEQMEALLAKLDGVDEKFIPRD